MLKMLEDILSWGTIWSLPVKGQTAWSRKLLQKCKTESSLIKVDLIRWIYILRYVFRVSIPSAQNSKLLLKHVKILPPYKLHFYFFPSGISGKKNMTHKRISIKLGQGYLFLEKKHTFISNNINQGCAFCDFFLKSFHRSNIYSTWNLNA